jgi:hypothetical protein
MRRFRKDFRRHAQHSRAFEKIPVASSEHIQPRVHAGSARLEKPQEDFGVAEHDPVGKDEADPAAARRFERHAMRPPERRHGLAPPGKRALVVLLHLRGAHEGLVDRQLRDQRPVHMSRANQRQQPRCRGLEGGRGLRGHANLDGGGTELA